jgi:hypothetical protein
MKSLGPEEILAGTRNARNNTWGSRYHRSIPSVRKNGAVITYSTSLVSVDLTAFDEVVLTVIMKFLFVPMWLVRRFYSYGFKLAGNEQEVDEMVDKWVQLGIVWKEAEVTGEYLRPTHALFQMFRQPPYRYCNIPFNTLRHSICEELVMFEVMAGYSEILDREPVMPRISELGFDGEIPGTNIIGEEDFRNPKLFSQYNKIMQVEHDINEGIKNGERLTPELRDFSMFSLVKKVDNTGEVKKDFKFHIPDLIIPVIRDQGRSRSIAIEVELSNKKADYEEAMLRYKDNNKFGSVYWLCNGSSIAAYIREAHEKVRGTGTCRTELLEFVIPSPKF